MAASWTAVSPALPTFFYTDGFVVKPRANTLYSQTLDGRVSARRFSTKDSQPFMGPMVFSLAQWAAFDTFHHDTLKDGSEPFQDLNHPFTGANTVWHFFADLPDPSPWQGSGAHLLVLLPLIALPDAPA